MIAFWTICTLLLAAALAFILPSLWRPAPQEVAWNAKQANLAVYRDQFADLETDRRTGVVANEQFEVNREELERRLLEDLSRDSRAGKAMRPAPPSAAVAYILAIGLPLVAVLLYLKLGNPNAL